MTVITTTYKSLVEYCDTRVLWQRAHGFGHHHIIDFNGHRCHGSGFNISSVQRCPHCCTGRDQCHSVILRRLHAEGLATATNNESQPDATALVGKQTEYVVGYNECYQLEARTIRRAVLGFAGGRLVVTVVNSRSLTMLLSNRYGGVNNLSNSKGTSTD